MRFKVYKESMDNYAGEMYVNSIADLYLLSTLNKEPIIKIDFERRMIFVGQFYNA